SSAAAASHGWADECVRPYAGQRTPPLHLPPPERRPPPVHLRFLRRAVLGKDGCDWPLAGDNRSESLGRNAAPIRRRRIYALSVSPRPKRRDGGGAGRIPSYEDARRVRHSSRGLATYSRSVSSEVSRLALFLRLSRVPESGGSDKAVCLAKARGERRCAADFGLLAGAGAEHLGDCGASSGGEVFCGVGRVHRRGAETVETGADILRLLHRES